MWVNCIQRKVDLRKTQRLDFVRKIHSIIKTRECSTIYNSRLSTISSVYLVRYVLYVAVTVAAAVDIHDCLYVCIGDGGGPARSSSIRTRATVAEVTEWRFTFPSWDPPETYHRRFVNVLIVNGPQYYYCSSQIQPDDTDTCGLYCLYYFKRRHRGMELPDIVKDFPTVDLKGKEDTIL